MRPHQDNREILYSVVSAELKILGIKVPKIKKLKLNSHKQDKFSTSSRCKVFGVSLSEQEWISENDCHLPKFLVLAAKYLEMYSTNEGLFRKTGSLLRQKELRMKIENGESWNEAQPNDVASLLKQWLRELPEPLIPTYLHDVFARCLLLSSEEDKLQSVLLSCLLLPPENLNTLAHLLSFLSLLVSHSCTNKMDAHNLAIIMTPNLLHTFPEYADRASIAQHTDLVELLITNADKVGQVPCVITEQMQEKDLNFGSVELSVEILETTSCTQKKRHKSGPVQDFVHEIRKLVGQNLTPVSCTRDQYVNEDQRSHKTTTYSTSKRKADPENLSSAKKIAVSHVRSRENEQFSEYTPVGKISCSVNSSPSVRKTIFSPLQSSGSQNKSGLLKRKGRNRAKSVSRLYRVGTKWLSTQNVNEPNLNSSYVSHITMDDKVIPHLAESTNSSITTKPVESSTPAEASIFYFPSVGVTASTPSVFSPVTSRNISKTENLVEDRENVLPPEMKRSFLNSSKNASVNSVEDSEDFQDINMVKKENICKNVSFSPLKVQNGVTCVVEKKVMRSSYKRRSLKNPTSCEVTSSQSCGIMLESNFNTRWSQKSSTRTYKIEKEIISQSAIPLKSSVDRERGLTEVSALNNSRSKNSNCKLLSSELDKQSSSPRGYLNRRTSRSCTNISDLKTEGSSETQFAKGSSKKGSTGKSSLRRGRPNTIKTGLPSDFCQRYLAESNALLKVEKQNSISATTTVDSRCTKLLSYTQSLAPENKVRTPKNIRT